MAHHVYRAAEMGAWVLNCGNWYYPFLRKLYADGGYQGPLFRAALGRILRNLQIDIAKRSDTASGFSRCCRSDGLWNEALPGLTAAVALRRIGKISISQR